MAVETGIIALIYGVLKDIFGWITRHFKKEDPEIIIKYRQEKKEEIEKHLRWIDNVVGYGRTIIRDVRRMDSYPEIESKGKGISPWFRVSLLGTYHKGIELGLCISGIKHDHRYNGWRYADYKNKEEKDINAILVGRIPYERIVSIDWDGDEYYSEPHFYCKFTGKNKEPYDELIFCEERPSSMGRHYYKEIDKYNNVRKLSEELGIETNR